MNVIHGTFRLVNCSLSVDAYGVGGQPSSQQNISPKPRRSINEFFTPRPPGGAMMPPYQQPVPPVQPMYPPRPMGGSGYSYYPPAYSSYPNIAQPMRPVHPGTYPGETVSNGIPPSFRSGMERSSVPSSFVFVPAISVSTRPSAVVLGSVPLSPLQLFAKELEETMSCVEKYEGEEEREEKKREEEERMRREEEERRIQEE